MSIYFIGAVFKNGNGTKEVALLTSCRHGQIMTISWRNGQSDRILHCTRLI